MKKKHLRMFRRIFAGTAILAILVPVRAQVSNPSAWGDFVKGKENPLVSDTFRMQTFSQSVSNNWNYKITGKANIPEGKKTLVVPPGSSVVFEPFDVNQYQNGAIQIRCAALSLALDEIMTLHYLSGGDLKTRSLYEPKEDNVSFDYKDALIEKSPSSMEFVAANPSKGTHGGCYLLSNIFAFGNIPKYSLFTKNGCWNDTLCWSHLPPLRHRAALISGNVEINTLVQCHQTQLANGGLHIAENGHFIVDELYLHSTGISLTVAGKFIVNNRITMYYTFPEKGKWYFLSFPFDVYLKEIDNRFQLKDEQFTGNGDYFYMLTYNGDKRSSTQTPTGNWEVFSLPVSSDNPLVFERGKGYLVALDAAASDNTLTFSVEGENIPEDFGKAVSIPVNVASSMDAGDDNSGWYLCGNPLPASLKLSQIQPDPALDGNIYLYDGKNYAPYAIGSNYELPPLAAFFVKASATTELTVTNEPSTAKAVLLKSGYPLRSELTEPINVKTHLPKIREENETSILKGNVLYLSGLSSVGKLKVVDVAGQLVYSCPVPQGSSVQSLPLRGGLYILIIEAGGYRTQHKCVLAQ